MERSFLVKLQDGDIGLAKTFWLFVVLSNAALTIPIVILRERTMITGELTFFLYFLGACVAWRAFTLISGWKASTKYTGNPIWKVLARVIFIVGWVAVASDIKAIVILKDYI